MGNLLLIAGTLRGAEPAIRWDGAHADYFADDDGPFTIGFQFRANSDLAITALGTFDYLLDGFSTAHSVGIWTAEGGAPIATANLSDGTTASLRGQFRYVDVSGITLKAGTEYVIGASGLYGATKDLYASGVPVSAFSMNPAITFLGSRGSGEGEGLNFPEVHFDSLSPTTFGANFEFSAVPEPSVGALLALGGIGLGVAAYRGRPGQSKIP